MLQMLKTYLDTNWYREEGATAVEYGIMVAAIAAIIIAVVFLIGNELLAEFEFVESELNDKGNN